MPQLRSQETRKVSACVSFCSDENHTEKPSKPLHLKPPKSCDCAWRIKTIERTHPEVRGPSAFLFLPPSPSICISLALPQSLIQSHHPPCPSPQLTRIRLLIYRLGLLGQRHQGLYVLSTQKPQTHKDEARTETNRRRQGLARIRGSCQCQRSPDPSAGCSTQSLQQEHWGKWSTATALAQSQCMMGQVRRDAQS